MSPQSEFGGDVREGSDEEVMQVRKALSGVARMSNRSQGKWEGKYGKGRIVQMLMGSRSQDILKGNLDTLSTYGLLKELGTAQVNELFQYMHDGGLIFTQKGEYPLVTLTPLGERVMHGKTMFKMVWPKKKRGDNPLKEGKAGLGGMGVEMEEVGFDPKLFSQLKDIRAAIAKIQKVPPYVVFSNKTLEYFTRLRPTTIEAGSRIKGVGEAKATQYLKAFVSAIKDYKG